MSVHAFGWLVPSTPYGAWWVTKAHYFDGPFSLCRAWSAAHSMRMESEAIQANGRCIICAAKAARRTA